MTTPLRVVQYGLGPIGLGVTRFLLDRAPRLQIVGAVDVDPQKVGRDVGELAGTSRVDVVVRDRFADFQDVDCVIHTTQSRLADVEPQLMEILTTGANIVSTCEELSYPWHHNPQPARRIDAAAKAHNATVTGVGINPGFAMDLLPLVMTAPVHNLRGIEVERRVDARVRRLPLQRKVGAGLTTAEFEARVAAGALGHVGLPESIAMIAAGIGWKLDRITNRVDPVVTAAGDVAGLHQVGTGILGEAEVIRLSLTMAINVDDPVDRMRIEGDPTFHVEIPGGLHGDVATHAIAVNTVPIICGAAPGLKTALDLPPAHSFVP
ncbi:MAG: dihydrodipicolinate reductase [Armatimonadetes bacterium]|nr:dihydrodipicolinate reductase [Armatimonadota bacterium]